MSWRTLNWKTFFVKHRVARKDMALFSDIRAATLAERNPYAGWSLGAIASVLLIGGIWASHARLDEITVGMGQVISSSRDQLIQSLDGGILEEIKVKEGDTVEKNQILLRIDDTRAGASLREGQSRASALRASAARLKAESNGGQPYFDAALRLQRPDLVQSEIKTFQSRLDALQSSLNAKQRTLALVNDELRMTKMLADKGSVSEIEVLRLQRMETELRGQIQDQRNKFRSDAAADLTRTESELASLGEVVTGRADQVKQTIVHSPMRGIVKRIRINTVGGVIRAGEEIMQIVPLEEQLLVEAKIRPSDVAFLHPGQKAIVKITAYDYSIYGSLEGVLEHISPDTIQDDLRKEDTFYRISVRTHASELQSHTRERLPIIPGMTATVEILTGHKTVMDYLLKPIFKARQAMRER